MGETNSIEWKIERIEANCYSSGRDSKTYVKTIYWYQSDSSLKKELKISYTASDEENLPDWTLSVQQNTSLENH